MADTLTTITRAHLAPGALPRAVLSVEPPLDASFDPVAFYGKDGAADRVVVPDALVGKVAQDWTWDGKAFAVPPASSAADLNTIKDGLKSNVDTIAEDLRLSLITGGVGQSMEYREAQAEAKDALTAPGTPAPADYPMLAASIGIDIDPSTGKPATDVLGVARAVDAARKAWLAAGAAIRQARLKGKAAIDAATTADAADVAYAAIKWPAASA